MEVPAPVWLSHDHTIGAMANLRKQPNAIRWNRATMGESACCISSKRCTRKIKRTRRWRQKPLLDDYRHTQRSPP